MLWCSKLLATITTKRISKALHSCPFVRCVFPSQKDSNAQSATTSSGCHHVIDIPFLPVRCDMGCLFWGQTSFHFCPPVIAVEGQFVCRSTTLSVYLHFRANWSWHQTCFFYMITFWLCSMEQHPVLRILWLIRMKTAGIYGYRSGPDALTHWGRVTHICVSKLSIIGSDDGLSLGQRQAIIWTKAGILLFLPLGTNFNEMLIEIHTFSVKKMHLKMSSAKWQPFCLSLNVFVWLLYCMQYIGPCYSEIWFYFLFRICLYLMVIVLPLTLLHSHRSILWNELTH